jgi:insertion element IS1 protein InsB
MEEVALDERWGFVWKKSNQWWLWHAIEHHRQEVLAYHVSQRTDKVFQALPQTLKCLDIDFYFTDHGGAYERHVPRQKHLIGKNNT